MTVDDRSKKEKIIFSYHKFTKMPGPKEKGKKRARPSASGPSADKSKGQHFLKVRVRALRTRFWCRFRRRTRPQQQQ